MSSIREAEIYGQTVKNYTQALLINEQRREDEKQLKTAFVAEMQTLVSFMDEIGFWDATQISTRRIDPATIVSSVELIADAPPVERYILRNWRALLYDRLQSYTRDKTLIHRLILKYFEQWVACWEYHSNIQLNKETLFELVAMGIQSQMSQSFMRFLQGPTITGMIADKKADLEKAAKASMGAKEGEKPSWQNSAV